MNYSKTVELLTAAKAILAVDRAAWTQCELGIDKLGNSVDANRGITPVAVCSLGAVYLAGGAFELNPGRDEYNWAGDVGRPMMEDAEEWLNQAADQVAGYPAITEFNDSNMTTYEDVLAVFDEAIRLASFLETTDVQS